MDEKKIIRSMIVTSIGVTLSYSGAALCAFASIGQGPVGAFQYALSNLLGVKMGIITFLFQCFFVAGQCLLEGNRFKIYQLLQLPICAYGSLILNVLLYDILVNKTCLSYVMRVCILFSGIILNAIGVKITISVNFIRIPLEGFLLLFSEKKKKTLGFYKRNIDLFFIIGALLICHISKQDICVREGTIINAIFFGTILDWLSKYDKLIKIK